jgi:hypothetical protein
MLIVFHHTHWVQKTFRQVVPRNRLPVLFSPSPCPLAQVNRIQCVQVRPQPAMKRPVVEVGVEVPDTRCWCVRVQQFLIFILVEIGLRLKEFGVLSGKPGFGPLPRMVFLAAGPLVPL